MGGDQREMSNDQRDWKKKGANERKPHSGFCTKSALIAGKLAVLHSTITNHHCQINPLKSTWPVGQRCIESMIKGSVYVYIFYMYTHDKDIITEQRYLSVCLMRKTENTRAGRRK